MITTVDKKWLIFFSFASIISTLLGNIFSNNILENKCYLTNTKYPWFYRLFLHSIGGVCGFGIITGMILVSLLLLQLILIINLNNSDKIGRNIIAYVSTVTMSVFFVFQLFMNSSLNYAITGKKVTFGLFEMMLPAYSFQLVLLILIFREN